MLDSPSREEYELVWRAFEERFDVEVSGMMFDEHEGRFIICLGPEGLQYLDDKHWADTGLPVKSCCVDTPGLACALNGKVDKLVNS